jgi:hypothetical protein
MRSPSLVVLVALVSSACQTGGQADEVEVEGETSSSEDESSSESDESETGDESETVDESETATDTDTDTDTGTDTDTEGGEPLWAIVEAFELGSEINQIWAIDLSDPALVGDTEILVVDSNYGGTGLGDSTPWGTHLVTYEYLDDWTTEQLGLDEQGEPELRPFVPPEIEGSVNHLRFTADHQRALVQARPFFSIELWMVDFAAGEPIGAELVTSVNWRDGSFPFYAITPDGSAALWSFIEGEFDEPSPLMLTPLEPELGPSVELFAGPLQDFTLQVDKLVYFTDENMDGTVESWLLPIDDLLATPTPGPVMPNFVGWSSDSQRACFPSGPDQVGLVEFTGLSFGATQVIDAPGAFSCSPSVDDGIIYRVGELFSTEAYLLIDLSSGTPSAPLPLTSAADSITGAVLSPSQQWFGYRAQDQAGHRLEVTDISGPVPGTPQVLLDQLDLAGGLEFIDDQHVLLIAATGSDPAELYVVDLAADPLAPVQLTAAAPAGQSFRYSRAVTPARDSVLFHLGEPGANTSEFLWRAGVSGSPSAEQLSLDAGWDLGRIETLPIGP